MAFFILRICEVMTNCKLNYCLCTRERKFVHYICTVYLIETDNISKTDKIVIST